MHKVAKEDWPKRFRGIGSWRKKIWNLKQYQIIWIFSSFLIIKLSFRVKIILWFVDKFGSLSILFVFVTRGWKNSLSRSFSFLFLFFRYFFNAYCKDTKSPFEIPQKLTYHKVLNRKYSSLSSSSRILERKLRANIPRFPFKNSRRFLRPILRKLGKVS